MIRLLRNHKLIILLLPLSSPVAKHFTASLDLAYRVVVLRTGRQAHRVVSTTVLRPTLSHKRLTTAELVRSGGQDGASSDLSFNLNESHL